MEFNIETLDENERDFLKHKSEVTKEQIIKHLQNGLSFEDAVITEATESLVSYYKWVVDNAKEEDKGKVQDWNEGNATSYNGENLNEYQKKLFDTLPNIGKWQVGNYNRMWRALEEADECLMEFIHHELNYLCNPKD
tara:strand:+ start:77 stop:487 length:411 start_codon:yes stop_codon:yes gene_type:complete